jgi:hypothetical protein
MSKAADDSVVDSVEEACAYGEDADASGAPSVTFKKHKDSSGTMKTSNFFIFITRIAAEVNSQTRQGK